MKFKYRVDEIDGKGHFVRSMNAYASKKRAEAQADRLNAEAYFANSKMEYVVCEA